VQQSAEILGTRLRGRLNFVSWRLIFSCLQYVSPFWCLEFWDIS